MLYSIDDNQMTTIPKTHRKQWDTWLSALRKNGDREYNAAKAEINACIDNSLNKGKDVFISSFMPGSDWTGTAFEPLYFACNQCVKHSGFFFGLLVWETVIERPEKWLFMGPGSDDEIMGKTYFIPKD